MSFNLEEERKRWELSEEELNANVEDIFKKHLAPIASPVENPSFVLIGGLAGSGKSELVSKRYKELPGNAIIIDQDELRTKYPEEGYKKIKANYSEREEFLILNPYIAKIIPMLIEMAKQQGYNIILETALQDVTDFIKHTTQLRSEGMKTELDVLAVPEVEANISMLTRYCYYLKKDGECRRNTRINPNAIIKLKANLQRLDDLGIFDEIGVFIRAEEKNQLPKQIYSQKQQGLIERPLDAFLRGQDMSWQSIKKGFQSKYEELKSTLQQYNDVTQLEKLELIYQQFQELERED